LANLQRRSSDSSQDHTSDVFLELGLLVTLAAPAMSVCVVTKLMLRLAWTLPALVCETYAAVVN
jgi:hypothetical protein